MKKITTKNNTAGSALLPSMPRHISVTMICCIHGES